MISGFERAKENPGDKTEGFSLLACGEARAPEFFHSCLRLFWLRCRALNDEVVVYAEDAWG
jgi:hypothetical protein